MEPNLGAARGQFDGSAVPLAQQIDVFPLRYRLETGKEYGSAKALAKERTATLVRIITTEGITGWGECYGPPGPVAAAVYELGTELVGQPIDRITASITRQLSAQYYVARAGIYAAAISGLDLAAWDAWARTLGVSLASLLGGRIRDEVSAYASTGYSTHGDEPERFEMSIRDAVNRGFDAVKIRVGLGVDQDERRTWSARELLGSSGQLMLDFNGNYCADTALLSLERLTDAKITWAEEPIPSDDLPGLEHIRHHTSTPLAGGEWLCTRFGFREQVARRLFDIVQPDLTLCGGLTEALAISHLATTWNLRISPHVWGGAIGQAASLQFAAILPEFPSGRVVGEPVWFEWDCGENPLRDALLTIPITVKNGHVSVPPGPGLGVDVDIAALDEFLMRPER